MPVDITGRGRKQRAILTCETCGRTIEIVVGPGAAPELRACEIAHDDHGWGYTIGFFAMLAGHRVFCPECARPRD